MRFRILKETRNIGGNEETYYRGEIHIMGIFFPTTEETARFKTIEEAKEHLQFLINRYKPFTEEIIEQGEV